MANILNTLASGVLNTALNKAALGTLPFGQNTNVNTPGTTPPAAPVQATAGWDCSCGHKGNSGKFCAECGKPQPSPWDCPCGCKGNTGKFCVECGKPKPAEVKYKCDKCGWEPKDKADMPKFCPECGDPFDEKDIA